MEMWMGLKAKECFEAITSIGLHHEHMCIMFITYGMWFWLNTYIVDQCKQIMPGHPQGEVSWLHLLITKAWAIHEARITTYEFDPLAFDPQMPGETYIYRNQGKGGWDLTNEEEQPVAISIIMDIIQHWLQFIVKALS